MKDAVGNELHEGDLVFMHMDRPSLFGRVVKIEEGGLITGIKKGGVDVRPAQIIVTSNHTIACDPRVVVGSLLVLKDPSLPVEILEKGKVVEMPN